MYFLARTPNQIVIVSVAVGLGLSVTSLLLGMIPDVTPGVRFGAVIGVYGSFEDLGVVIGPLMYGLVWSATSPIYIFAVSAVAQVLSAILILAIQQQNWLSRHISSIASLLHG
jgi:predicted MFS family arabinose efflux permease